MVKFQKQLSQQLVPEWTDAYCNYKLLKQQIKKIKQHHHPGMKNSVVGVKPIRWGDVEEGDTTADSTTDQQQPAARMAAAYASPLATVTGQLAILTSQTFKKAASGASIQVQRKINNDMEGGEFYETEILEPCIAAAEHEKVFFKKLDEQLNIVDTFYRRKESEYVIRAYQLQTQIETLLEMQKALARHRVSHLAPSDSDESLDELDTLTDIQISASAGTSYQDDPKIGVCKKSKLDYFPFNLNIVNSREQFNFDFANEHRYCKSNVVDVSDEKCSEANQLTILPPSSNKLSPLSRDLASNISVPTPLESIYTVSRMLWEDLTGSSKRRLQSVEEGREECVKHISKRQVKNAEKMLRAAFREFYRGLTLLASFSSLNRQAFEKIMKKYDKVTGRHTSDTYLRAIETSYFAGSDKVVKLMDRVEGIFTEHFTKNPRQAMAYLKPTRQKVSHSITFLSGLFSGCSIALFMAYLLMLELPHQCKSDGEDINSGQRPCAHSEGFSSSAVFPIFSTLALLLLHLYLYGCNVYLWQKVRINYAFIFEFAPGTELRSREVLLVSTGLTTVLTAGMVAQLMMHTKGISFFGFTSDIVPLVISMVFLTFLFMPLNLFYKSSRRSFLHCLMRVVLSPFYKVVLADFFLADQITSQVTALRNLEYAACYYLSLVSTRKNGLSSIPAAATAACTGSSTFLAFQYIVSILPYWWRIMQCLRRWMDERDLAHIANGGKYLSALVAVVMRVAYTRWRHSSPIWLVLFIISSIVATIYQLYWDIVVDWGLLQKNSVNPWLRDQLVLKRKYVYFLSMVLNLVLRLAWIYTLLKPQKDGLSHNPVDLTFAALEVVRRGHWNFYRLENEHLNNVGKYRAVKQVPLPFKHTIRHRL